jgi:hypothetical protein
MPPPKTTFAVSGPAQIRIKQGELVSVTVRVLATSKRQVGVKLGISGLPSGITALFSPISGKPTFQSTLTISAAANSATGNFSFTISATGGGFWAMFVTSAQIEPRSVPPPTEPPPPETYDFYVDSTRPNDSGDGTTIATAKKTVAAGVALLSAGKTLGILNGTYILSGQLSTIPAGTSWGNAVTIKAYTGHTPILGVSGSTQDVFIFDDNQKYIIIDGIIFDGTVSGTSGYNGIEWSYHTSSLAPNHIRVINCEIKNFLNQGLFISTDISSAGTANEIINNSIHNNGTDDLTHGIYCTGWGNLFERNHVYSNTGYGFHLYDEGGSNFVNSNIVRKNLVHNNGTVIGAGIILSSGHDNQCYDNIVYSNGLGGIFVAYGSNLNNTLVYNNTVYDHPTDLGIWVQANSTGAIVRNNINYQAGVITNDGASSTIDHNVTANPHFVSDGVDFHLTSSSTNCIDQGLNLISVVVDDYDGVARPGAAAFDIGAYEYIP